MNPEFCNGIPASVKDDASKVAQAGSCGLKTDLSRPSALAAKEAAPREIRFSEIKGHKRVVWIP